MLFKLCKVEKSVVHVLFLPEHYHNVAQHFKLKVMFDHNICLCRANKLHYEPLLQNYITCTNRSPM